MLMVTMIRMKMMMAMMIKKASRKSKERHSIKGTNNERRYETEREGQETTHAADTQAQVRQAHREKQARARRVLRFISQCLCVGDRLSSAGMRPGAALGVVFLHCGNASTHAHAL